MSHAGEEHLDPESVARYDRKQGYPDLAPDLDVFTACGLGRTSVVVDLGAGTGQFAFAAAQRFGRVYAVDISSAMLDHLRRRADEANLTNLDCVQAGFLSCTHDGLLADGVYTRNALHHLPDFWQAIALDRMAGFMRLGGVLRVRDLIYDFQPSQAEGVIEDWLEGAVGDPSLGYTRADLISHIRDENSTFRWLFEPMLESAGFEIITADFRRQVYAEYTCIKRT